MWWGLTVDAADFTRMTGPSSWPEAPGVFSFSSLHDIEGCPRRWQLHHARWGDHDGLPRRANERALVGVIVHEVNEVLMRALALRGLPAVGAPEYLDGVKAAAVHDLIRDRVREIEESYRDHPRDPGFRVRATPRDIANEALRLFRRQYADLPGRAARRAESAGGGDTTRSGDDREALIAALSRRGVLAEVWLSPEGLPLRGQVDLVLRVDDGVRIVDLKTGVARAEYWEQLALYALLWWRVTGEAPVELEIAHRDGREFKSISVAELVRVEDELLARVAAARDALAQTPAEAKPGSGCGNCGARAFCDAYWEATGGGARTGAYGDWELVVEGQVSAGGVGAMGPHGEAVAVVFEEALGRRHGPWFAGERLRVLGASVAEEETTLRLSVGTEVFRRFPTG